MMKHTDSSRKNVTIGDIAKAAGVSRTTVSRFLNGKFSMMSEDTRSRIETVIRMSNYHPNSLAQSLRGRNSMQIGVVISDISSPFCSSMVRSVGHTLLEANYVPLIVDSKDDPELEEHLIQTLLCRRVDGLIVNSASYTNPNLIRVACEGVPVVLCDRYVKDFRFPFVGGQDMSVMPQLLTHLKEEGFCKVAFFTQDYRTNSARLFRRNAYLQSVRDYFPDEDGEALTYVLDLSDNKNTARCIRQLLDSCAPGEIPAIVAVNSVTSTHIAGVLESMNLEMPGDLGLCGPDDWGWDSQFSISPMELVKLTAFNIRPGEIGSIAAKTLIQLIQNPETETEEILLPMDLVIRRSTQLRQWREAHK